MPNNKISSSIFFVVDFLLQFRDNNKPILVVGRLKKSTLSDSFLFLSRDKKLINSLVYLDTKINSLVYLDTKINSLVYLDTKIKGNSIHTFCVIFFFFFLLPLPSKIPQAQPQPQKK